MIGNISKVYGQKDQASAIAHATTISANNDKLKTDSKTQKSTQENTLSTRVTISEEALKKLGLKRVAGFRKKFIRKWHSTFS